MKNLVITLFIVLSFLTFGQNTKENYSANSEKQTNVVNESVRDGLFIHITESYNDPHRVLMPMKMASMMSKDKDVLIYLDIHAVELVVKTAEDLNFDGFESFQTYLKILLENNAGVYACPTCLKIAGFKVEDLIDGVKLAEKEKFFNFTNGRIITLDY